MTTKIALFDIDGTLLPHGGTVVPQATIDALKALKDRHFPIAVATGRIFPQVQPFITALNFDYYVCANGHIVTDDKGNILADHPLPKPLIKALVNYCVVHNYPIGVKFQDLIRVYVDYPNAMKKIFNSLVIAHLTSVLKNCVSDLSALEQANSYNALVAIDDDVIPQVRNALPDIRFDKIRSGLYNAGLYGFTKANGIELLLNRLGINWDETIIFGDAENDCQMITNAGIGVAMGDGQQAVKDVANYVTGSCADTGIKQALTHYGLIDNTALD